MISASWEEADEVIDGISGSLKSIARSLENIETILRKKVEQDHSELVSWLKESIALGGHDK